MALLDVIQYGHPTLRKVAEPVKKDELTQEFLQDMIDTMYERDGVGLAAPQVNISKRIFTYFDGEESHVVINPKIVAVSERKDTDIEGCLSLLDLQAMVPRHDKVIVEYRDSDWTPRRVTLRGLMAVVFQHEIDHLNGVLYIDRADLSTLAWTDADIIEPELREQATNLELVREKFTKQYHAERSDLVFDKKEMLV